MSSLQQPWPFSEGFEFYRAKLWDAKAVARAQSMISEAKRAHLTWGRDLERERCDGDALDRHGSLFWREVKLDGWRCLGVRANGLTQVFSRGVSKVTGLPIDVLREGPGGGGGLAVTDTISKLPWNTAVEGELVWPGHRATEVPNALKSRRDELQFHAFGLPWYDGKRLSSLWEQRRILVPIQGLVLSQVVEHWIDVDNVRHPEALDKMAEFYGHEGYVIKATCTKLPMWFKCKADLTDDVVVLDATDARYGETGKFYGQVGALVVGVLCRTCKVGDTAKGHDCWDFGEHRVRECTQVSGMEDADRKQMTEQRDSLPGRICEIRFQAQGAKDRLRHARFIRWRDDEKNLSQCDGENVYRALGLVEQEDS